jgi:hypothetical protein
MHDGSDRLFIEDPADEFAIADIALVEGNAVRNDFARTGGKIVDDDRVPARILQRQDRVTADIAGAAGDEDGKVRRERWARSGGGQRQAPA